MPIVTMSPVARTDATELLRANRDSRAHHVPWVRPFTDQNGFERWFGGLAEGTDIALVAREERSGAVAGVTHLSQISRGVQQGAYLGFYGNAAFAGRGLMTEAVRLTVRHAFDAAGLHRIEANVQPCNVRSLALLRRVGFRQEGFSPRYLRIDGAWRDHERWAVVADD
ncbi:MAG: GNAT family N-acetyltransferase [Janthinobacterium lividum]